MSDDPQSRFNGPIAKSRLISTLLRERGISFGSDPGIPRRARTDLLPLSYAQQRLWFLDQLEPGKATYNIPCAVRLSGVLDVGALQESLQEIVRRHEVLRTSFPMKEGNPVQEIEPEMRIELAVKDLMAEEEGERERVAEELAKEEAQRPFDLSKGGLIRARVLRLEEEEHVLLVTMHHIVSDGWSLGVLVREFSELYEAHREGRAWQLPELKIQYADYAEWQRGWLKGEVLEEQLRYWKEQLQGLEVLEIPTDKVRPAVASHEGASVRFSLTKELTRELKELSRREGVTLFMTLLAGYQVLLHRYSGQEDIAIGTPVANRNRGEIEGLIGFFVNTLVLRTDLRGKPAFREVLKRVREVTLGAYAHQEVPFEKLVEELAPERDLSRSPLFQVMLVLQNAPVEELELSGLRVEVEGVETGVAKFDVTMSLQEAEERIAGVLEYDTDLFDQGRMERMAGHFEKLLEGIVADPEGRVGELPLLTEGEREQLLKEWNETGVKYQEEKCIHEMIEEQVERTPGAVAVVYGEEQLTYEELNRRANRLAHYLRKQGVGAEERVGICMERSLEMVVGLLGILKAGGAYVPLDPEYPDERLKFMVQDAGIRVLLAESGVSERLAEAVGTVVSVKAESEMGGREESNPKSGVEGKNAAYVIYTSGSSGRPKGVINTHGGIRNRLQWMQDRYGLSDEDCVLQKTSFGFDVSVWEFFWPLMNGSRLAVAVPGGQRDSEYLVREIAEQKVTTVHFVPAMLQSFLREADERKCGSLRRVICSGEALPLDLELSFLGKMKAELHNLYGPTEAAIDVTSWVCQREEEAQGVPIGRPIANTQIYILDEEMQPVPVGVSGEAYIGGAGVARGYVKRPELKAEKFVPNPFGREGGERLYRTGDQGKWRGDGNIEVIGRIDDQVKIRGYRIELGEIETILRQHPAVQDSAVAVCGEREHVRLTAYIVPRPDHFKIVRKSTIDDARALSVDHARESRDVCEVEGLIPDVRAFLSCKLPEYMKPTSFVILDRLPLTSSGIINRLSLSLSEPLPTTNSTTASSPTDLIDFRLQQVWEDFFKCRVGIDDNFFDIGGTSLFAVALVARIKNAFGRSLPLAAMIQNPTI